MQTTEFVPVHVPDWQVSVCVQALPSEQAEPFALVGVEHCPFAGLEVPGSWHWSSGVQTTGVPLVQTPLWQVSIVVHALPSLQGMPSDGPAQGAVALSAMTMPEPESRSIPAA